MSLLRTLLLVPYNIWAYGTFFLLAFIDVILYAVTLAVVRKNPGPLLYAYGYWYSRIWSTLILLRYEIKGRENFRPGQAYVITANHRGLADLPLLVRALEYAPYRPLGKMELKNVPILGYLFKNTLILIDRKNAESRKHGVEEIKKLIQQHNISPLIFPEGTRNRTDKPLKEFYDGAFRIAIECQVPILPMVMLNVDAVSPQNSLLLRPGKLYCHFLPPIDTHGLTLEDTDRLKQQVFDMMWKETEMFISIHGNR